MQKNKHTKVNEKTQQKNEHIKTTYYNSAKLNLLTKNHK